MRAFRWREVKRWSQRRTLFPCLIMPRPPGQGYATAVSERSSASAKWAKCLVAYSSNLVCKLSSPHQPPIERRKLGCCGNRFIIHDVEGVGACGITVTCTLGASSVVSRTGPGGTPSINVSRDMKDHTRRFGTSHSHVLPATFGDNIDNTLFFCQLDHEVLL
jgi:hypothetical protein